ncbi:MAG: hypothetical protein C4576_15995 [Desulfobacteraceae bacterium]|nr:MAG: hypothetical protein C4576_15995 [Desulfobacteraceae bacterium]
METNRFIYWKEEDANRTWKPIPDTPQARAQALKQGAMFFTWCALSEPHKGNGGPEPHRWGDFPLDFDSKEDPKKALTDLRQLCLVIMPELYSIDPYAIRYFASGSKGFHAEIPAELFGAKNGDPFLPIIYKRLAAEWREHFNLFTLDLSLYNMKQGKMFRLPNVRRQNGRYKVPLTMDEVRNLSIQELTELTKQPREIEPVDVDLAESTDLGPVYRDARARVYKDLQEKPEPVKLTDSEKAQLSKNLPPCIGYILKELPAKSAKINFNRLTMVLVTYFQFAGIDEQTAWSNAEGFFRRYPYSESYDTPQKRASHWRTEWNYLQNNGTYTFNCAFVKSLGLPGNAFDCRKCIGKKEDTIALSPLTPEQTSISQFVRTEPPETEYLIEDILPKRIVGAIIGMGGVSKSYFEITLGIGLATGKPVLKHFKPVSPVKVLALFGEDPDTEIHRRLYFTVNHTFPDLEPEAQALLIENLHLKSVMGQIGPLMQLDQGNPARSRYFEWLHKTIEAHKGLDVLILDPKSRFYGLDENSNDHATQWVACLEELSREFGLTILFSHHVNKASGGALLQSSARGGSALVDACRWVANLRTMDEQTAKRYDLEDFRAYVEFDVSKSNYAPQLPGTIYFRRGEHGVLVPVNLEFHRLRDMADELCSILAESQKSGITLTKRELLSQSAGKEVRERLKDRFGKANRNELSTVIEYAMKEGLLTSQTLSGSTNSRGILWVER